MALAWFLDAQSLIRPVKAPPMSQNIAVGGANRLGVLFESWAQKFVSGSGEAIEHVIMVDMD